MEWLALSLQICVYFLPKLNYRRSIKKASFLAFRGASYGYLIYQMIDRKGGPGKTRRELNVSIACDREK